MASRITSCRAPRFLQQQNNNICTYPFHQSNAMEMVPWPGRKGRKRCGEKGYWYEHQNKIIPTKLPVIVHVRSRWWNFKCNQRILSNKAKGHTFWSNAQLNQQLQRQVSTGFAQISGWRKVRSNQLYILFAWKDAIDLSISYRCISFSEISFPPSIASVLWIMLLRFSIILWFDYQRAQSSITAIQYPFNPTFHSIISNLSDDNLYSYEFLIYSKGFVLRFLILFPNWCPEMDIYNTRRTMNDIPRTFEGHAKDNLQTDKSR